MENDEVENPAKFLHCLSPALEKLRLHGRFIGKLDSNTFSRFINLSYLDLSDTHLTDFDLSILENFNQLQLLDVSQNNLKSIGNVTLLNLFKINCKMDKK